MYINFSYIGKERYTIGWILEQEKLIQQVYHFYQFLSTNKEISFDEKLISCFSKLLQQYSLILYIELPYFFFSMFIVGSLT